jgi:hypothetical protein
MTRRTQKSSRQRKRQYTRRHGGAYSKRGQWIWTVYCIMRDGIEQCFRKRTLKVNNNTKNNNNTKKRKQKEQENRNELEAYYRY